MLAETAREAPDVRPSARYVDVQALAFAIVHALEDRDNGLKAEIDALRREVAAIADALKSMQAQPLAPATLTADTQDPAALSKLVAVLDERIAKTRQAELSASLQETLRSDLTRLIERIETRSRTDQVVALREEVRAQLGALGGDGDLASLREVLASELAMLREQLRASDAPSTPAANGLDVAALDAAYDPSQVSALRRELVPDGGPLIGAAGRLEPEKGFDVLIQAMPRVLAQRPDARLVIAGEGSRRHELEALVTRLGLTERVRLLGARPDLFTMMHAFDVFALSSRAEPFGLVMLEAMAARKPVVATSAGGAPEIVLPDETGTLVPPEDAAGLADGLLAMLADPERARCYGEAGRQRVEAMFSLDQMLGATESLYRGQVVPAPVAAGSAG